MYFGEEYRQRGRFAGFSLYVSNTGEIERSTLCYKDGPQLPLLNFTTSCTEYGQYVIFYNERNDGVFYPKGYQFSTMYTELCEVIVKGILYILNHESFLLRLLFTIYMQTFLLLFPISYKSKSFSKINQNTIWICIISPMLWSIRELH